MIYEYKPITLIFDEIIERAMDTVLNDPRHLYKKIKVLRLAERCCNTAMADRACIVSAVRNYDVVVVEYPEFKKTELYQYEMMVSIIDLIRKNKNKTVIMVTQSEAILQTVLKLIEEEVISSDDVSVYYKDEKIEVFTDGSCEMDKIRWIFEFLSLVF